MSDINIGLLAENQFLGQLEQISIEENVGMAISDINFDRGYTESDASFVMTLDDPSDELPKVSVLFESKMKHMPINSSEFGLSVFEIYSQDRLSFSEGPEELIQFVNNNMAGYFLSGYSRANVLGSYDSVLSTPVIDFASEVGEYNVQVDSMVINSKGQLDGSETELDMKLPSMNIKTTELDMQIDSISAIADLKMDANGLGLGNSLMQVAQLSVMSEMGVSEVKNITVSSVSDVIDNKINTTVSYNVESIASPLPVSSASYNIDFNGLPVASVELAEDLQLHINDMGTDPESADEYFNQLLTTTLQPGLQINQELKASAFGGNWQADLNVEYVGIEGIELAAMQDPKVAVKSVVATLVLTADNAALSRSPLAPMLDGLLQQGLITLDNTSITSVARLTAGKLMINEVEIPVEPIIDSILLEMKKLQELQEAAELAAN